MKIIALYKTWRGEEFIDASLESIYDFVDKIVFVHSNTNWLGEEKNNTVKPVVRKWKQANDIENKIIEITADFTIQDEQYNCGLNFIRDNLAYDFIMLIDSDEIWDTDNLGKAKEYLKREKKYDVFTCEMRTFIKSILFQIDPVEWCKPVVFLRNTVKKIEGARANNCSKKLLMKDVFFWHFTYVRKDLKTVIEKARLSTYADGSKTKIVDIDKWIKNKWDKLPYARDFHTTVGAEKSWQGIKVIEWEELPVSLKGKEIAKMFSPLRRIYQEFEVKEERLVKILVRRGDKNHE